MQHPVAYQIAANGTVHLVDFWGLLLNPWGGWQYVHTMAGSVVTAAFVMAAVGAYYLLLKKDEDYGKIFIRTGIISGIIASVFVAFPSGDAQGKNVALNQPITLAAMEGLFETKAGADLMIVGQPDMEKLDMDNPLYVPEMLSFLTYNRWNATVKGLDAYPRDQWPDNIPLLYYSYHIMVGLGTMFITIMVLSLVLLWRKRLFTTHWALWILLLSFPFPYIANTAGWMTAELGRQPFLVYGLMRTIHGVSPTVSAGNTLFTLLGFLGMYFVIGVLFLMLLVKHIAGGPAAFEKK